MAEKRKRGGDVVPCEDIRESICTIRGVQVMLDTDLAGYFGVEVRRLNEQVKRNSERFPEAFCFQLTDDESTILKSQFATSRWGGRRTRPYAFTEQGVAMLSAVLKTDTAVRMSVRIINEFVAMRRFINTNTQVFLRLDTLELRQLETDKKLDGVLDAIEASTLPPKHGIFFDGQVFDAYRFATDVVKSAERSIIVVDNYLDDSVLVLLSKKRMGVAVTLYSRNITPAFALGVDKLNAQHPTVKLVRFGDSHDRFIIIDNTVVYHIGASLKDLGKKWFAFSRLDIGALDIIGRLASAR